MSGITREKFKQVREQIKKLTVAHDQLVNHLAVQEFHLRALRDALPDGIRQTWEDNYNQIVEKIQEAAQEGAEKAGEAAESDDLGPPGPPPTLEDDLPSEDG